MDMITCIFGRQVMPPAPRHKLKPFAARSETALAAAMHDKARSEGQHNVWDRYGPPQGGAHLRPEGAESVALRARIMEVMAYRRLRFHTIMSETGATERRARDALNRLIKSGDVGFVKSGDRGYHKYHRTQDAPPEAAGAAATGQIAVSQEELPDKPEHLSAGRSCAVVVIEKRMNDVHGVGHEPRLMRISLAAAPWEV